MIERKAQGDSTGQIGKQLNISPFGVFNILKFIFNIHTVKFTL